MAVISGIKDNVNLQDGLTNATQRALELAIDGNANVLNSNLTRLGDYLNDINQNGLNPAGITSTKSVAKYALSGNKEDDSEGYLEIKGSNLLSYDRNQNDWFDDGTFKISSLRYFNPSLNDQEFSVVGSINVVAVKNDQENFLAKFNLRSITAGDKNLKVTLTGNLTLQEELFKNAYGTQEIRGRISGGFTGVQVDVNDVTNTFQAKLGFSVVFKTVEDLSSYEGISTQSFIKINSVSLTQGGVATPIFNATKLNIMVNENDEFINAKGEVIDPDLSFIDIVMMGNDVVTGTSEDDLLSGYAGNDQVKGGDGNDWLDGGVGDDTLTGGMGNDIYIVDSAKDKVTEATNQGFDTIEASVSYVMANHIEKLQLVGANALRGTGNAQNNEIIGSSANNTLLGGLGNDVLTGGLGADNFVFNTKLGTSNIDTITDFTSGDRVQLSKKIFTQLKKYSTVEGHLYIVGQGQQDADDYLIFNTSTQKLSYDADGSGTKFSTIDFVTITGVSNLTAGDIDLIA